MPKSCGESLVQRYGRSENLKIARAVGRELLRRCLQTALGAVASRCWRRCPHTRWSHLPPDCHRNHPAVVFWHRLGSPRSSPRRRTAISNQSSRVTEYRSNAILSPSQQNGRSASSVLGRPPAQSGQASKRDCRRFARRGRREAEEPCFTRSGATSSTFLRTII